MNYHERLALAVRAAVTAELAECAEELVCNLIQPSYDTEEQELVARAAEQRAEVLAQRADEAMDDLNAAIERSGGNDETHTLEWIGCDEQTFRRAVEEALDRESPED
jgi:predicted ATPase